MAWDLRAAGEKILAVPLACPAPVQSAALPAPVLPRDAETSRRYREFYDPLPGGVGSNSHLVAEDFDGDGDPDLWVSQQEGDRLLLNDGSARFRLSRAPLPGDGSHSADAADVDGDVDVVKSERLVLLNDGDGTFTDASAGFGGPDTPFGVTLRSVRLADVDGDGDPDLWLGHYRFGVGWPDVLLLNDGSGSFLAEGATPDVDTPTSDVEFGDVDGDGDLDVVIATEGVDGAPTRLFLNEGGAFVDASDQLPPHEDNTHDVALGDVDGDGDLDLVLANLALGSPPFPAYQVNRLYRNDGSGTFAAAPTALPEHAEGTRAVALGDHDGDGDLDIWFGNGEREIPNVPGTFSPAYTGAATDRLYSNDGTGTFASVGGPATEVHGTSRCGLWRDLDGDGDLDLVVGSGGENLLFLGSGGGGLAPVVGALPPLYPSARSLAAADFDGDGLVDLFAGRGTAGDAEIVNEI